mmetsp:Transcript_6966/g.16469  ORF Transcript_6966/g.16469 Transcript_6966/m.16469 type:complete len:438 (-) Transcript_6966:40-1353(-)
MVLRASVCAWLPANVHCWWDLADGWQKLSIMVGTTCALVASLISAVHFSRHACNAAVPSIKFCTLKIVFMVPFFSVDAVACLLDSRSKYQVPEILTFLREFYEAVVLVAFLQLVLNCLGGPEHVAAQFAVHMQRPEHPFCLKVVPTFFKPGIHFILAILWGLLQYVVVMILVTCASVAIWICKLTACVGDDTAHFWSIPLKCAKAMSCGYAMYNLTLLYFEILRNAGLAWDFENLNPEMKFICIKGVIMFTYLQGFGCTVLAKLHFFDAFTLAGTGGDGRASPEEVGDAIENLLLCVEMLLFSIMHLRAYPSREFDFTASETSSDSEGAVVGTNVGWWGMLRDIQRLGKKAMQQERMLHKLRANKLLTDDEMEEMFNAFDVKESGHISVEQFRYMLETGNCRKDHIDNLTSTVDRDGDRCITRAEFRGALAKDRGAP